MCLCAYVLVIIHFVVLLQYIIHYTADYGDVHYDISFGGTFYAYTDITQFGLDIESSPITDIVMAATKLKTAVATAVPLSHPEDNELAFLYGINFYSGSLGSSSNTLTIFADGQVSSRVYKEFSTI